LLDIVLGGHGVGGWVSWVMWCDLTGKIEITMVKTAHRAIYFALALLRRRRPGSLCLPNCQADGRLSRVHCGLDLIDLGDESGLIVRAIGAYLVDGQKIADL
jgi:hypothetical protein